MQTALGNTALVALLGRRDEPTDALRDYCAWLGQALQRRGIRLETAEVAWDRRGWPGALWQLWKQSDAWRGRWVLVQYTALGWSRRGLPFGLLAVLGVLRSRRAMCVVVFHDAHGYGGQKLVDRLRRACQHWVMRTAYGWTARSILTIPIEKITWLPARSAKAVFIPVGANLPERLSDVKAEPPAERTTKTVAIFGVTGGKHILPEVRDIAYAVNRATQRMPDLRLVVLGRHSEDAREALTSALDGSKVDLSVLGLLPAEEVSRTLAGADVLLFVRGQVSSRRGSAIAGIACGLPVVGYAGPETAFPVTEAGVVLVPQGNREALAEALTRVLADETHNRELRDRSRRAQREYFSWNAIAELLLGVIGNA